MGDGNVFNTTTVNHFYTVPGTYTVSMEAYDLVCDKTETISQDVSFLGPQLFEVIVPNVITPNGDEINDEVKFEDADPTGQFNVIIWNRWGTKVYESNNSAENWKGTKENGKELETGLYYYELIYKDRCSGQDEQLETGFIHLLR
jgi:gliding motility-associated-like protein